MFDDWCEVSPIGDLVVRGAQLHPERDLIVFPDERYTYAEVLQRASHVARGLYALGVRQRDHVGLLAHNGPEYVGRSELDRLADTVDEAVVEHPRLRVRVRDTAVILYTSGTTAHPKGCLLSHEAMTRGAVERARKRFTTGDHDVTWGAGPLFHIGSLAPFLGTVGACGTYLTDVHFDAGR